MAAAPPDLPGRRWSWQNFGGKFLVLSVIVHLMFLSGAAVMVVQTIYHKRKTTFIAQKPGENAPARSLEHSVKAARQRTMSAPVQARRVTANVANNRIALPQTDSMPTSSTALPSAMAGMGGAGLGPGLGGGGMGGGMGGGGSSVMFFGVKAQVKSVVVVVDVSRSMVGGKKNAETYEDLEKEVIKLITGLTPTTKFNVVTFARGAEAFKPEAMLALPDEKSKAVRWLKSWNPAERKKPDSKGLDLNLGTRADMGLEMAFKMKPDTIFFVSDGAPTGKNPDQILKQVEQVQKRMPKAVAINTIAYLADNGQKFMKDLADENKGRLREVNPKSRKK